MYVRKIILWTCNLFQQNRKIEIKVHLIFFCFSKNTRKNNINYSFAKKNNLKINKLEAKIKLLFPVFILQNIYL